MKIFLLRLIIAFVIATPTFELAMLFPNVATLIGWIGGATCMLIQNAINKKELGL